MEPVSAKSLLEEIRAISIAAGDAIMEIYGSEFDVELKEDQSPLTEADRASHNLIVAGLNELHPTLPILSEESAPEDLEDRRNWDSYWLVDPLDGTKEFVKRNGEFTVNIALIENNRATMGVVFAPALELEYSGALDLGAWKRTPGEPLQEIHTTLVRRVQTVSSPAEAIPAAIWPLISSDLAPTS